MSDWYDEQTDDPLHADRRNFYKVEKWSRDGLRVEPMLYAGNTSTRRGAYSRKPSSTGRASG